MKRLIIIVLILIFVSATTFAEPLSREESLELLDSITSFFGSIFRSSITTNFLLLFILFSVNKI